MKKLLHLIVWALIAFFITYAILSVFGLVPESVKDDVQSAFSVFSKQSQAADPTVTLTDNRGIVNWVTEVDPTALPKKIIIEKIGVFANIENPKTIDIAVLDAALLRGVVHYPGSGTLKDVSNLFFFGHSTNHTSVYNQAYKAFNRLDELNIGDEIRVQSESEEYIYRVSLVSRVDEREALVTLSNKKKMLTLTTCDTFGKRSDRFVVEAEFMKSRSLKT